MAYRYQGNNNDAMVASLEEGGLFSSQRVKKALIVIPRGDFIPEQMIDDAYVDRPLKTDFFNISAPHMYAFCLETLNIQQGQTFLDVGSGCGHMTALGGYLVGAEGIAHGLDILDEAISLSKYGLSKTQKRGTNLNNVSFEKRNVFLPDLECRRWDRIHVGASCPHKEKHKLYELLNPGGILVMPIGSSLVKIEKDRQGLTRETKLLEVRYGELILPTLEEIAEAERIRSMQVVLPVSSMKTDYVKMFNNKLLSDIVFMVEGKPLYGHKAILASRSEYFSSLYNGSQATENEVIVSNYSHVAFHEFLRFIYTDECKVDGIQVATELMGAADAYGLLRLKALMELLLSKAIDVENSCPILETAHRYGANQLKRIAFEYILSNYDKVSKTAGFLNMPKDCITEILHVAVRKINQAT